MRALTPTIPENLGISDSSKISNKLPRLHFIPVIISEPRKRKMPRGRQLHNLTKIKKVEHQRQQTNQTFRRNLQLAYINIGSMKNKTTGIYDFLAQDKTDILALTETWLLANEEENHVCINAALPTGFSIEHCPRKDGRTGGGVALIYRDALKVTIKGSSYISRKFDQFEYLDCKVKLTNDERSSIRIVVLYRPPPTKVNKLKLKLFWRDWIRFLPKYSSI